MTNRAVFACVVASVLMSGVRSADAGAVFVETFDIQNEWSNASNPTGRWSYLEGSNPLPPVAWWQSSLGGWSAAQPGWARSENGNNRLPFWFKSNGTETFPRDFIAGDVVLHTTDSSNGVGQGLGAVEWRAPFRGVVNVQGAVWMGRDIGRSNAWRLYVNGNLVRSGSIASGDPYSRANPFRLVDGAGPGGLTNLPIGCGGTVRLEFERTSSAGDFVGVSLSGEWGSVICEGDINADGIVNTADLVAFLAEFGQTGGGLCADFNNDSQVNTSDLAAFLGRFGSTCP
ncbi:MAG: hypothetical protein J0L61_04275 [Planctomycetes bacterium]|nr:hypothetical protein [Planctomycetota bacterium]